MLRSLRPDETVEAKRGRGGQDKAFEVETWLKRPC